MVVILVASVVLCTWSLMFGRDVTWLNRAETRWLLALQLLLLLMAYASPNIWVGIAIAWIAIHPWLVYVAYKYGILEMSPSNAAMYSPLIPILWWAAFYLLLAHLWSPGDWAVLAWSLVVWGIINTLAAIYQLTGRSLPSWWLDRRTPSYPNPPGFVGGSFMLAWITAAAILSGVVLLITHSQYYYLLYPALAFLLLGNYFSGTRSPILALAITLCFFLAITHRGWISVAGYSSILILAVASVSTRVSFASFADRLPGWRAALVFIHRSRGLGVGLGMWHAIFASHNDQSAVGIEWQNLHNDWLQSVAELGVVPAICGLGVLATSWYNIAQLSQSHDALFGLLLLTFIAVYAIPYFPFHDHGPSLLAAASLAMIGGSHAG